MPEFTVYNIDVEVDVDVDDFLDECSEEEIKQILRWLKDNEYLFDFHVSTSTTTASEEAFYKNVEKLSKLYFAMSVEDSAVIETILNKY
jgi:hypothetical protein